jgi:hypothetical protein
VVAIVTQFDSAETVQVQSRVADTPTDPVPPVDGNGVDGAFVMETVHFAADGSLSDVVVLLQLAADPTTHAMIAASRRVG